MKIGASAHIFWNYATLNLTSAIQKLVALGYESVEITCDSPLYKNWGTTKSRKTTREIKKALGEYGIYATIHAPHHDINIASWNQGVTGEGVRQIKECIKTANYLESEIVVVHPSYVASRKFKRDKALDNMIKSLGEIIKFAESHNITICLENLALKPKALCAHIDEMKFVLNEVNSEKLKVTLDVAHANTTGINPAIYATELKEEIKHVHLSDNTGQDNHLPLGLGNINFEEVIRELLPYDGVLNIEGWMPHNQEEFLAWDRRKVEEIVKHAKD